MYGTRAFVALSKTPPPFIEGNDASNVVIPIDKIISGRVSEFREFVGGGSFFVAFALFVLEGRRSNGVLMSD